VRGIEFEDFAGTKESQKETETDCQLSSANSIPRASAEKIDELFGRRFLHNRDATMTADEAKKAGGASEHTLRMPKPPSRIGSPNWIHL